MKLDKIYSGLRRAFVVNRNTHQKTIFCARLHLAAGAALYIFHTRPGAAS